MSVTHKGSKPGLFRELPTIFFLRSEKRREKSQVCGEPSIVTHEALRRLNDDSEKYGHSALASSEVNRAAIDGVTYPEGGLQAWLVTFGSFCGMFAAFGVCNSLGTFTAYLSEHQLKGYDESTISWIFSIYIFLIFVGGLQIGPIFDAKGPRGLISLGSILVIVSTMILSICTGKSALPSGSITGKITNQLQSIISLSSTSPFSVELGLH